MSLALWGLLFCALPPARPGRRAGFERGTFCVEKKRFNGARWGIYILGMVLLAMGITMNSLTGLGASAIVSVPFTVSEATGLSFGDLTLIVYVLFVGAEFVIMGKKKQLDLSAADPSQHCLYPHHEPDQGGSAL